MGTFSIWHWLVVLAVVLIMFGGGGKVSRLMGDFGRGLRSFKKGMREEDGEPEVAVDRVEAPKVLNAENSDIAATPESAKRDTAVKG